MKKRVVFIFLIVCTPAIAYFICTGIYSFLAYNKPVKPDVLVVEGWLPYEVHSEVIAEFRKSGYRYIITTGFPHQKGFTMGSEGDLCFTLGDQHLRTDTNLLIKVTARGTKAYKIFPHFTLFADTVDIGDAFVQSRTKDFFFSPDLDFSPSVIRIRFDNDIFSHVEDRNLIVYSISINGKLYSINDSNVTYSSYSGLLTRSIRLNISKAHETAVSLIKAGIPDSLIFPVGSFQKIKSRTYTNGLDVYQWLLKHPEYHVKHLMILTSGSHARRSYLSYHKAIRDKSVDIGVISCYNPQINHENWWKSGKGLEEIAYESIGYIYALIFL
jgi:hypothetical protein